MTAEVTSAPATASPSPSSDGSVHAVLTGVGWGMLSELQLADPGLREAVVLLDPRAHVDVPLHRQRWRVRSPSLERLTDVVMTGGRTALGQLERRA